MTTIVKGRARKTSTQLFCFVFAQERTNSIAREAELQREAAEEARLREEIRKVTQRVAEGDGLLGCYGKQTFTT